MIKWDSFVALLYAKNGFGFHFNLSKFLAFASYIKNEHLTFAIVCKTFTNFIFRLVVFTDNDVHGRIFLGLATMNPSSCTEMLCALPEGLCDKYSVQIPRLSLGDVAWEILQKLNWKELSIQRVGRL